MTSSFLLGVLTAWSLAHLGMAVFFSLSHLIGRRERAYLLFALLSGVFSLLTGGMALDFAGGPLSERFFADQLTHMAAILAAIINLHFALSFARPQQKHPYLAPLYGVALLFVAANWLGALWVPGSHQIVVSHLFGLRMEHAVGQPTLIGMGYYVVASLETLFAAWVLLNAYWGGQREALPALVALSLVLVASLNDMLLDMGMFDNTLVMLPHVFMLYAFAAAGTLLFRYRVAARQLELTASSLQQKTEELRRSYAELAQVQSELVTKKQMAAVGELAAAIAHEVRNPLAVIVNAVSGLRRSGIRDEDRKTLLDIVNEEAARLNRLVTDLLLYARPVNVNRSPVSLVELAKRCAAVLPDGIELRVEALDDAQVQVDADPNLLRLVFDNLVANACQAMGYSGTVEVRITRAERFDRPAARIDFKDGGHGMEPSVLKRALDPFYTTRPSGTGLGLPIVHRIIEAHGGELTLDSAEGEGTRVTIVLPVHAPEVSESEHAA